MFQTANDNSAQWCHAWSHKTQVYYLDGEIMQFHTYAQLAARHGA